MKSFRCFARQILCPARPALSLCFHSFSRCDCFVASSHDFDDNKQLDHEITINFALFYTLSFKLGFLGGHSKSL